MISLKEKGVLLVNAFEDEIEQEANSTYQLSFKYPVSDPKWAEIEVGALVLADDVHGEQEFRIFEITKRNGYLFVYANQVSFDLNEYLISAISVDRVPGQMVMSALAGSVIRQHPFNFFSDIQDRHTFNQKSVSVMDALAKDKHSIIGQWGGDLVRDKYSLRLLTHGGRDTEHLFMYKKNLKSYAETDSVKGLVTRLYLKKTIQGQEGEADQVLEAVVDSPLIDAYKGRIFEHAIEVSDENITTQEQLVKYGQDYFRKNLPDVPKNSLTIEVTDNHSYDVRLFDTVLVHHEVFEKDLRLKITSYKFSPMSRKLKSIGFGKTKTNLHQQISSAVDSGIEQAKSALDSDFDRKLQKQIDNANQAFEAEFEKNKQVIEDGIEEAKAAAEVVKAEVGQSVLEAEKKANQALQAMQSTDQKASEALAKAGASDNLARLAKETSDRAVASSAQTGQELANKSRELQEAVRLARENLSSQADQIRRQAQVQDGLSSRLITVEETANGTKATLTELSKTVNSTTGNLASVTQRVASTEAGLTGVRDQYSQLNQTVSGQIGQITVVAQQTADLQRGLNGVTERFEKSRVGMKNLVPNSKINESSNAYGFATRQVKLEAGKTYWFGARAKKTGGTAGKEARVWLIAPGWADSASLSFTSMSHETKFRKHVAKVTATYDIRTYWFPNGGDRSGTADIDWYMVVESDLQPTDWVASDEDIRKELATYVRTATENTSRLEQAIQTADDKAESAKTLAQQTAQGLELKAEKTSLDGLTGRMSSAEGSLRLHADQIAQRLTSTQVDNLVAGKGYQTKSQIDANITGRGYITNADLASYVPTTIFDNYKRETAQSIEQKLTATKADILGLTPRLTDFNAVKQTAQLYERIIGSSENDIAKNMSRMVMASDVMQTEIRKIPTKTSSVNLVPNSKINESSNAYGFATRQVKLEAGKTYWFGARAKKTGGTADREVKVWLIAPGWAENRVLSFAGTDYETKFLKFVPRTSAVFDIRTYWFPNSGDRSGTADIDWYMVVESDTQPTGWAQAPEDTESLGTRVTQLADSWAVKTLSGNGDVLSAVNVATGGVAIQAGQNKLVVTPSTVYVQDGTIKNAMIESLYGGKIQAGTVGTAVLQAEAVTADKLKVDQAFFNKFMANEAYLKQLFAKEIFSTSVQSVSISANQISGGKLTALNKAMEVNLNQANIAFNQNATIEFNSANNALVRRKGTHTAFVHFNDVNSSNDGGVGSVYASIGVTSSGDGINSASSGRFAGARFFRGARGTEHTATVDQAEIYGDIIILKDGFDGNRGFKFTPVSMGGLLDMNKFYQAVVQCALAVRALGQTSHANTIRQLIGGF